jgi:hypothetical protein
LLGWAIERATGQTIAVSRGYEPMAPRLRFITLDRKGLARCAEGSVPPLATLARPGSSR